MLIWIIDIMLMNCSGQILHNVHVFVFEWSFWRVIGRKKSRLFFIRPSIKVESWLNNYAYSEVSLNNQRQSLFINIYKVPFRTFWPFCSFQHSTLWILEKFFCSTFRSQFFGGKTFRLMLFYLFYNIFVILAALKS